MSMNSDIELQMRNTKHPKDKGQRSEAAVLYEFVNRGITVLEPFGDNERYDLVAEIDEEFYRVQIKTGRLENGRVQFETRSSGSNTNTIQKDGYQGEIDIFAVHSPELAETFIVPIADAPKTSMGLRVKDADKISPNINWANDFTIDHWLSSI